MLRTVSVLIVTFSILFSTLCHAEDLDDIRELGVMTFAMSGQYPPFNFVDEYNQLTGFDVEVCSEISRRIGVEPKPLSTSWDGIIAGLLADKYDLICGSMAITEERLKAIDFSDPYYRSGAQLFVREGSPLESAEELSGKKVGVPLGTTY